MKKVKSSFAVTAVITSVIVGALALCAWFSKNFLENYLNSMHSYGSVTVIPYGHHAEGVLTHSWDSLKISTEGNSISITGPSLDLTIWGENKGGIVSANKIEVTLLPDSTQDSSSAKLEGTIRFPEKAKLYLPVKVDVNELQINRGENNWSARNISIKSEGVHSVRVMADSIQGEGLGHPTDINVAADFSYAHLTIDGRITAGNDSIHLQAASPKNDLMAATTKVDLTVNNLEDWLPVKIPDAVPDLGKFKIKGEAKLDEKTHKPHYDVTLHTRVGEFWPLQALNVNINIKGDNKRFRSKIHLTNDEGGTIDLDADMDMNLDGSATGKVSHMSAMFGPQMMPMDVTIHSAEKKGNVITVATETRQGSLVDATIDLGSDNLVTYTGNMSPYEPWALDWTKGNLIIKDRFKLFGTVSSDGVMRTLVKIDSIPFVYHVTADSLQTVLVLNKHGIDFVSGTIYTPKETFDFTGDVKWDGEYPHTSWDVTQRHGGHAYAYISIIDSTTIKVKSDSVEFSTIPFAKIKFNENVNGRVSGFWNQNFDTNVGELEANIDGNVKPFHLQGIIKARENGDTVFIDKAEALQNANKVEGEAIFILPNDSNPDFKPTPNLPIQVLHAWMSSKDFNIPLLLEPLNDSTLTSGFISGDIAYSENSGLQGNVDFTNLVFGNIPSHIFNVKKMNLFAEASKMELNAYLGIGGGGWTGNTQIILDDVFSSKRHVSISHNSDNGGDLYAEGFLDSTFTFDGKLNMHGSWFIPGTVSEVKRTDLQVDVKAKLKEGIRGITAVIRSDSTFYQPPKMRYTFPLKIRGRLENSLLEITEAKTQNDSGEVISATVQYDLDSLKLRSINLESDRYTLRSGPHTIVAENISGSMTDEDNELVISANIPTIRYLFQDNSLGDGEALGRGNLSYTVPHSHEGVLQNSTISGNLIVDKLVYKKNLEIEVTPNSLDKFITLFNNAIAKLRSKETEAKISSASPINLAIHINDSQNDSIEVVTPFATFPFTFDIWVLGNTNRPLLRGDVSNSNNGFIGVKELYEFDLNSFRISWTDVPWQQGVLDISGTQELPYCDETEETENETCPINLDIQGSITNPQATPSSNCGNESSSAAIYYNIFLGCIANDTGENTDWNKLAGKAIGKMITSTANRTLGGNYIGDIDMKVMLFNNTSSNEKDSSYFKLPISLDRWVKDLSLVLGYTQDQSENPTYDQSLQFGINYTLPVFRDKEYSHKNHLNPTLSLFAQLVSKQYLTNTGTESNESRIEKNIGVNYIYKYWNPCLLGVGRCENQSQKNEEVKK